jgi:predicted metal-dependent hydrolase
MKNHCLPEKIICKDIKHLGPVLFQRSRKAKRISISIKPFSGLRVALPHGTSLKQAEKFVHAKLHWIDRHLVHMKALEMKYWEVSKKNMTIDREVARRKLSARLDTLAAHHGFKYNKLSIRFQKTRWGSCSARNNISLNAKLIRLPKILIDYVLLHELLHTRIKNHGQRFWSELQSLTGDARGLAARLGAYWFLLAETEKTGSGRGEDN